MIDRAQLGLLVHGPYRSQSGYGRHTRAFVKEFDAMNVDYALLDTPQWSPAAEFPARPERTPVSDCKRLLHFCMPHQALPLRDVPAINFTMFEGTKIGDEWIDCAHAMEAIVVPTESSRAAWLAADIDASRVHLCPLGVDSELFAPSAQPLPLVATNGRSVASYRTRFLNISEVVSRKNLPGLMRAWLRATRATDDAILIFKLRTSPSSLLRFLREFADAEAQTGIARNHAAPVLFFNEELLDAIMPRLHAVATHYISMSHGEGWDQPMMEAAVMNRALIAPRHSAYTHYLDDEIAELLPVTQVTADRHDWMRALFGNADWWVPDEAAAIAAIRAAIDGTSPARARPRDRIASTYTWRRAAERLVEIVARVA